MKKIVIKRGSKTFKVTGVTRKVSIKRETRKLVLEGRLKRGLPGQDGADGAGVPTGGLPGQTIVKVGSADFDTEWAFAVGTDKYYVQDFLVSSSVLVNHGLLKFPSVTVHHSAGDEVEGQVEHLSINSLQLTFSAPFSGRVTCN